MSSEVNEKIFKAYDIRGIYPEQLNKETAYRIGKAYVQYRRDENPDKKFTIVVARDMRLSSPELSSELMRGITDMGADVVDIGLASTPTFYYAVAKYGYDGGLIVSASHNPKQYNGVKVVKEHAVAIGLASGLDKIRDYAVADVEPSTEKGTITTKEGVLAERVQYALSYYDFSAVKDLKIISDCANAMGSPDLTELFEHIDCELVKMNFELDGTFPSHPADPFQPENIVDLCKKIKAEGADLGIAIDGDADRIFFIDDKGEFIDPAIIRGIVSKVVLEHNPGATICYDIRPGMITRDMIVEHGGKPSVTRVGHTLIKQQGIEEGAPFSGESSGHMFFKSKYGFYETPLIVALVLMDQIKKEGKPISEIIKPLQKYSHSGEINSEVEDKEGMMKTLEATYGKDAKNVSWLDGVTIEHEEYWFNVRASNTEPLLRLNLEARSQEVMEKMRDEILGVIRG